MSPEQRADTLYDEDRNEVSYDAIVAAIRADRSAMRALMPCGHAFACRVPTASQVEGSAVCAQCVRELQLESEHLEAGKAAGRLSGLREAASIMCPGCAGEFTSVHANKLDMATGKHGKIGLACKAMPIRERMAKP